jgi:4-diphosphocytidyl-2-C-methyl-D-erythritol kinase
VARLTLPSFAKINLFLSVRARRADGYHTLDTLFERISLRDTVSFRTRPDKRIDLVCAGARLPCDERNLAFRAAALLQGRCRVSQGVSIVIEKVIPVGSGMGGGSSNAATALLALNRLWKLGLSLEQLAKLGGSIGSDVPFFVYESRFALGKGRGERIVPLPDLESARLWHIVVVPRVSVSTPEIYRAWDRQGTLRLTRPGSNAKLTYLALKKRGFPALTRVISNSLEPVTESLYPQVTEAKRLLVASGAKTILMSGSGPAVVGIVPSRKEAREIYARLGSVKHHRIFLASTA